VASPLLTNRVVARSGERSVVAGIDYTLFDTAIGRSAIAWGEQGIVAVQLPAASESRTRARIMRMFPEAREASPPPAVQRAIDGIVALLHGEVVDLSDIALDISRVPDFHRGVYAAARTIPVGRTLTYGEIAERLGDPSVARDVGQALGENPFPIIVPCHRVLAANGKLGGFSAPGGTTTKLKLLRIEGAEAAAQLELFPAQPTRMPSSAGSPRGADATLPAVDKRDT
jgi:methylated-DNA-[protein]-cysteine S-methyltransferase